MAKPKASKLESDATESQAPEVAPVEDVKVAVSMTSEQAKEFANFLAQKETNDKAKEQAAKGSEQVLIQLRYQHRRNRVPYGPGQCYCAAEIADSLIAADHKALQFHLRESQSNDHLSRSCKTAVPSA
jgi:hypothetical protein